MNFNDINIMYLTFSRKQITNKVTYEPKKALLTLS